MSTFQIITKPSEPAASNDTATGDDTPDITHVVTPEPSTAPARASRNGYRRSRGASSEPAIPPSAPGTSSRP